MDRRVCEIFLQTGVDRDRSSPRPSARKSAPALRCGNACEELATDLGERKRIARSLWIQRGRPARVRRLFCDTQTSDLCLEVVEDAITRHRKCQFLNSASGSQLTCAKFTVLLMNNGIQVSIDGKGLRAGLAPWDEATTRRAEKSNLSWNIICQFDPKSKELTNASIKGWGALGIGSQFRAYSAHKIGNHAAGHRL